MDYYKLAEDTDKIGQTGQNTQAEIPKKRAEAGRLASITPSKNPKNPFVMNIKDILQILAKSRSNAVYQLPLPENNFVSNPSILKEQETGISAKFQDEAVVLSMWAS